VIPISPVVPGYEKSEIIFAKDQPEYLPLPALRLTGPQTPILSRWKLDDEERARIARGADILLTQMIFDGLYNPIQMEVSE
jgi:hypothetical protein